MTNDSLKTILELDKKKMGPGGSQYKLIDYIDKRTHLIKAEDTLAGNRRCIIYKGIVRKIEKRRAKSEFDCRTKTCMENLMRDTHQCEYVVSIQKPWMTGQTLKDLILWYAMDYVDGPTTAQLKSLYLGREVTKSNILDYFVKLCQGVQALHAADFIHRDLKYRNILMEYKEELQMYVPKIIDFNLGKNKASSSQRIVGTEGFMGPEKLPWKEKPETFDIFPLGVMLFEILDESRADTEYFVDITNEIFDKHKEQKKEELEGWQVVNILLDEMQTVGDCFVTEVIKKTLQPEPANRYQSAREMMYDLRIAGLQERLDKVLEHCAGVNSAAGNVRKLIPDLSKGKQAAEASVKELGDFLEYAAGRKDLGLNRDILNSSYLLTEGLRQIIDHGVQKEFWGAVFDLLDGRVLKEFDFSSLKNKDVKNTSLQSRWNEIQGNLAEKDLQTAQSICRQISEIAGICDTKITY